MSRVAENVAPINAQTSIEEMKAQLRRQAVQKNATWPSVLLKHLVRLVDDHDRLQALVDERSDTFVINAADEHSGLRCSQCGSADGEHWDTGCDA